MPLGMRAHCGDRRVGNDKIVQGEIGFHYRFQSVDRDAIPHREEFRRRGQHSQPAGMLTGERLRGDLVQFVRRFHCLQNADLRFDIQIAMQAAKLQIEIDERDFYAAIDNKRVRQIGREKTGARAAFTIDHDDELSLTGSSRTHQFVLDSRDAGYQIRL